MRRRPSPRPRPPKPLPRRPSTSAREEARTALGRWTEAHGALLAEEGARRLAEALELTGEADAVTLADAFTEATAPAVQELRDTLAALRAQRTDVERRRAETEAERGRIAAEHDDAPPPARGRTSRQGVR